MPLHYKIYLENQVKIMEEWFHRTRMPLFFSYSKRGHNCKALKGMGTVMVVIVWQLDLQLPVPIITNVVSSKPTHGVVYSIQHYVIKFVRDLRQVCDFLRFPPSIKLTHDITRILFKVMLKTITLTLQRNDNTSQTWQQNRCNLYNCKKNVTVTFTLSATDCPLF